MGVLGLWQILESVGHPIKVEGLEGKRLGVDANVWLYKFIRGFREKDNATSIESHKLGLFNRVSKLLFYKIKPVFVFDGPAPILKRRTLERRQNIRHKHLTKVQDAAMRALAEQIKKQYPNANIDEITIKLPEFKSNSLVAAEKLTDDDRDLFYLPPDIGNFTADEGATSDESQGDTIELKSERKFRNDDPAAQYMHEAAVDINSKDFENLPAEIRYEILQDIKQSRRRILNAEALPDDAGSFSNYQLERLKARRLIQEKIEKCEKDICSTYTGECNDGYSIQAFRMQSDATSTMILRHNNVPKKQIKEDTLQLQDVQQQSAEPRQHQSHCSKSHSPIDSLATQKQPVDDSIKQTDVNSTITLDDDLESLNHLSPDDVNEGSSIQQTTQEHQSTDSQLQESSFNPSLSPTNSSTDLGKLSDEDQDLIYLSSDDSDFIIDEEVTGDKSHSPSCSTSYPANATIILDDDPEPFDQVQDDSLEQQDVQHPISSQQQKILSSQQPTSSQQQCLNSQEPQNSQQQQPSNSQQHLDFQPKPLDSNQQQPTNSQRQLRSPQQHQSTSSQQQSVESRMQQSSYFQSITTTAQQSTDARAHNKVTTKIIEEAKELLRLFGIPYIDAAGEAEAQCALLEKLKLTEGTITDDSDIWLFGAQNVFRYFFSDDKYVMQYKMTDIEYHVRLNRENLVCFAMLVGSDYTDGIMNVGPVTALEILSEFPGDGLESLVEFKKWRDNYKSTRDPELKRLNSKKRAKLLKYHLPDEFPSRAVFEGYMRPVVDTSAENFTWGTPELDELREYARRNFAWDTKKVDEKLLPVMKKLSERRTQTTLDTFFFKTAANQNPEMFRSKRVNQALSKIAKTRKTESIDPEVVNLSETDEDERLTCDGKERKVVAPKKTTKGTKKITTETASTSTKQTKVARKQAAKRTTGRRRKS